MKLDEEMIEKEKRKERGKKQKDRKKYGWKF